MENWEYLDIHLSRRLTLKTNLESPPKIKDEQSVFPVLLVVNVVYFVLRKAGSDWLQTEYGSS